MCTLATAAPQVLAQVLAAPAAPKIPVQKPNIVLIYADDIGWGDLSYYGAKTIATPNADRLAAQGLRFTNGYCTSSTCTPSRYSLLTGEYAFRKTGTGILPGGAPLIIEPNRKTLPAMLKSAGYNTSVVGKWHLGLGGKGGPNWNGEIKPGPLEIGFDESFIFPATADRVPMVFVENHRVFFDVPANADFSDTKISTEGKNIVYAETVCCCPMAWNDAASTCSSGASYQLWHFRRNIVM